MSSESDQAVAARVLPLTMTEESEAWVRRIALDPDQHIGSGSIDDMVQVIWTLAIMYVNEVDALRAAAVQRGAEPERAIERRAAEQILHAISWSEDGTRDMVDQVFPASQRGAGEDDLLHDLGQATLDWWRSVPSDATHGASLTMAAKVDALLRCRGEYLPYRSSPTPPDPRAERETRQVFVLDPNLPPDRMEFRDPNTGKLLGTITGLRFDAAPSGDAKTFVTRLGETPKQEER